ncbi:MAG: hypothetical protein ACXWC8_15795 [Limisphaerales bacterium]
MKLFIIVMRKPIVRLSAAMAVGVLTGLVIPRSTTWEYDFRTYQKPRDMKVLSEMGEDGWEVAGLFRHWNGDQAVLVKRKH